MSHTYRFISYILILILISCSPEKKIATLEAGAQMAQQNSEFQKAYIKYAELIKFSQTKEIEINPEVIKNMAIICKRLDKYDEAAGYFKQSLENSYDSTLFVSYVDMLKNRGLKEEEFQTWKTYYDTIHKTGLPNKALVRQLRLALDLNKQDEVSKLWDGKSANVLPSDIYVDYMNMLSKDNDISLAYKVCNELLKHYPDNIDGLKWKAIYYYNKAETEYQDKMAKYNKDKNPTTYAYLKRDLKKISADFRSSRDLFLRLHKMNKNEKLFIKYLKNIYIRLDNNAEAAKYDKML